MSVRYRIGSAIRDLGDTIAYGLTPPDCAECGWWSTSGRHGGCDNPDGCPNPSEHHPFRARSFRHRVVALLVSRRRRTA